MSTTAERAIGHDTADAATASPAAAPLGRRRLPGQLALHLAFLGVCGATLFPPVWMLRTALAPADEVFSPRLAPWPDAPTLGNFAAAFRLHPVGAWLANSLLVAAGITAGKLALAIPAGFAFACCASPAAISASPSSSAPWWCPT